MHIRRKTITSVSMCVILKPKYIKGIRSGARKEQKKNESPVIGDSIYSIAFSQFICFCISFHNALPTAKQPNACRKKFSLQRNIIFSFIYGFII